MKWIAFFFYGISVHPLSSLKSGGVTWYPTGRREIKLLLLVFELTVSSRQKKWPLRKKCGSHRGDQVLALSNLRSPDTGRGKREKANDWLGPQNGSGAPFPSAEVKDKKNSFWAGFVASGRTIAILLRVEDKRITETRRTPSPSSQY